MQIIAIEILRDADFKLCHLTTENGGRFPSLRYKCVDGKSCHVREIKNDYVDAMTTMLTVIKYVALVCSPWVLPLFVKVAKKKRFAVIGPHLWTRLDETSAEMLETMASDPIKDPPKREPHDGKQKAPSDLQFKSLTIEVDEDDLESATEPVSISALTSFYESICLCGVTRRGSARESVGEWLLRLARRLVFVIFVLPIPFYIRFGCCDIVDSLLSGNVDDVVEKMLGIRNPIVLVLFCAYVPTAVANVILLSYRDSRHSLYNLSLRKAIRLTQRTSWLDAVQEFRNHLLGIFRKRNVPKGKSTIMSSLQLGHNLVSPLRRSKAWPFVAATLFPFWFAVCATWFVVTLVCYVPLAYFAFTALVMVPFRLTRGTDCGAKSGGGLLRALKCACWCALSLGNIAVLVFILTMALEVIDVAIHVVFYVVMGVVVHADAVLPFVTLALLLFFYTHLANVNVRKSYACVKDHVFSISRDQLAPDFVEEMRSGARRERERVEKALEAMRTKTTKTTTKTTKTKTMTKGSSHDIVDLEDFVDGELDVGLPNRKSFCHAIGGASGEQSLRVGLLDGEIITCSGGLAWFVDRHGTEYLPKRLLARCLQNPHFGPGTLCRAAFESAKRLSVIYLFMAMVFLFLKMYGLLAIVDGSVNRTLITLGTGLMPLLFHFLFINMRFSMLKKKEHLAEEKRERLERWIRRQLGRPRWTGKIRRRNGEEAAVQVQASVIHIEKEEDREREGEEEEEEDEDRDSEMEWWTVANYHLLRLTQSSAQSDSES